MENETLKMRSVIVEYHPLDRRRSPNYISKYISRDVVLGKTSSRGIR